MKILIVLRMPSLTSYFESIIVELTNKHDVHVLFLEHGDTSYLDELASNLTGINKNKKITYNFDEEKFDVFLYLSKKTRQLINYLSFRDRETQSGHYLKRYWKQLPTIFKVIILIINMFKVPGLLNWLYKWEQRIPISAHTTRQVEKINPDLILVSPHNKAPGKDFAYIKAGKILSIPTSIAALSWDNLTTKGIITTPPDLFIVWNESQKKAASKYHYINEKTIKVVGAPLFDKWLPYLQINKGLERTELMNKIEIKDCRYVLYLGSATNITGDESNIINELLMKINERNVVSKSIINLVVRPHPNNTDYISKIKGSNCYVYPRNGKLPENSNAKDDFYASVKYAECVVAVNTSGILDALVIGSRVIALCDSRYSETQKQTLHFKELLEYGCIEMANGTSDTVELINRKINGDDSVAIRRRAFISKYIRPVSHDKPVALAAVNALEQLGQTIKS
jgi:hypothetical protein